MVDEPSSTERHYDVVVIGGAFSGASAALLLRRLLPESSVLVVEQSERFPPKVGEATVEISALYLLHVLGLFDHLSRDQLPKHGLRYWFTDDAARGLEEMSEIGPGEPPRLPTFQLDRSKLDEHLLALAAAEGAEVERPARVGTFEPSWPASPLEIEGPGGRRRVTARWVIDASGRHAFIARRLRLLERNERHAIAAVWARFEGVLDLDGPAVLGRDPQRLRLPRSSASRRLATNHFCGYGWWCWLIPLSDGRTSVGLVYEKTLFQPPGSGTVRERFLTFLHSQAGLRELLAEATPCQDDCLAYSHLPYCASRYMDRGWALVGDAASFIDPFYSPGLDHASISAYATVRLLESDLRGELDDEALGRRVTEHNEAFLRSYGRWTDALYVGKYELFGDAELTSCAFLVDTALYYLGVVTPAYSQLESLRNPIFGVALPQATLAFRLTRAFNRRLQRLAQLRRRSGLYGRRNVGWRLRTPAFGRGRAALKPLRQGLLLWLKLELQQLARTLLPRRQALPQAATGKS